MSFDMTYEGYQAAVEWCEENDIDIDELLRGEQSTDGYTVIKLVNELRSRGDE